MIQTKETYINRTRGCTIGEEEWRDCFFQNGKNLFKSLQKQYGRCESKIYIDVPMGDGTFRTVSCGWVFSKYKKEESFILETWIELKEIGD